MIKITNNKETKVVTKGAYNSFYKPLGFNIVEDKPTKMTKESDKKYNFQNNKEVNKAQKTIKDEEENEERK